MPHLLRYTRVQASPSLYQPPKKDPPIKRHLVPPHYSVFYIFTCLRIRDTTNKGQFPRPKVSPIQRFNCTRLTPSPSAPPLALLAAFGGGGGGTSTDSSLMTEDAVEPRLAGTAGAISPPSPCSPPPSPVTRSRWAVTGVPPSCICTGRLYQKFHFSGEERKKRREEEEKGVW